VCYWEVLFLYTALIANRARDLHTHHRLEIHVNDLFHLAIMAACLIATLGLIKLCSRLMHPANAHKHGDAP
jgi:hypothetical protein